MHNAHTARSAPTAQQELVHLTCPAAQPQTTCQQFRLLAPCTTTISTVAMDTDTHCRQPHDLSCGLAPPLSATPTINYPDSILVTTAMFQPLNVARLLTQYQPITCTPIPATCTTVQLQFRVPQIPCQSAFHSAQLSCQSARCHNEKTGQTSAANPPRQHH